VKVGDLVKSKYSHHYQSPHIYNETFIITKIDNEDYVVVSSEFLMRKDELEVISESR
jgi:hypothetical protein